MEATESGIIYFLLHFQLVFTALKGPEIEIQTKLS